MTTNRLGARAAGCEIIAALMKTDGLTHRELMDKTGLNTNCIYSWIKDMRESGILYRRKMPRPEGRRGAPPVLYCLQPRPFEIADWAGAAVEVRAA